MEIQGELSYRDGGKRKFLVPCDNSCKGLIVGLEQLKAEVSHVLSDLVLKEKTGAGDQCVEGEEEDTDEDDDEEEDLNDTSKNVSTEPPSKRKKSQQSRPNHSSTDQRSK
ncbi:EKC/KEOPS complex subunit GON7 [Lissotriton helveticus]